MTGVISVKRLNSLLDDKDQSIPVVIVLKEQIKKVLDSKGVMFSRIFVQLGVGRDCSYYGDKKRVEVLLLKKVVINRVINRVYDKMGSVLRDVPINLGGMVLDVRIDLEV